MRQARTFFTAWLLRRRQKIRGATRRFICEGVRGTESFPEN
jgi:hypothetical protein